ncbi:ABC-F family ATP-binding cassette domain-containing protein [Candidatus Gracilibacteria bacterium]|nr:ABC-F family ATP-binding cassette domain-containing protein [Candidatus Gracilibacteria bacterium]
MDHLKIKIEKLEFQGEPVLRDIELTINQNDKISIVGPNGSGKTTFMKTVVGNIKNYEGFIENVGNMTLGYLHQVYSDNEEKTVHEELREAFTQIQSMERKLKELEEKMSEDTGVIEEYTDLLEQFGNIGGYEFENKIHQVSQGIGVLELLDKKLSEISGGQRTKVALAKVLLESPDMLFLDEPTNFIDMSSVEWLESYLQNKWNGGYVIISHDREFLDKTCTKTLEIQPGRPSTMYHSGYSDYVIEREKVEKIRMDDWGRQQDYIGKQEQLINRFRAGSRAGWAKSREKMIEKIEKLEKPFIPQKPNFFFEYSGESPEKLVSYKEAFIGRSESLFFINEITLHKGMRVGVVGENGVGKSTFIKTILGQIPLLDGYQSIGKASEILYYSQMHEELYKDLTMRENFHKHGVNYPDEHLIGLIKHYLFEKTDLDKKVSELSGGQTSKLLFAILGQKSSNLLIFDEPTNHLDYDTRESLEESLRAYKGTILFISHDRYFVNKLATHIWFIHDGELSISYGNYEDYRFKIEHKLDMDMHLFDEQAELNLVLEEKLGEKEFKRLKNKFSRDKKRRR